MTTFWSEIGSGFEEPGGTAPTCISRSAPPGSSPGYPNASRRTIHGKTMGPQYPKFCARGAQWLKLHHDVGAGSIAWLRPELLRRRQPSERRDGTSFHVACTRCKQNKNTSKSFLDTFRRPQMIDLWPFFATRPATWTNACSLRLN